MDRVSPRVTVVLAASALACVAVALPTDANARISSPRSASDTAAELAACVRELRTETPALRYPAGVVRCLRPTRVETHSDVRWSTCKGGGAPAPGERCETGSARIELRATDADWEFRRHAKGYPREAERWHLYGQGEARCTRTIHGLPAGDPRARRTAAGRIEHVDFLMLWPAGSSGGAIALGVHPGWSNWLKSATPADAIDITAPACRPLVAAQPWSGALPPSARLDARALLDPAGVTVTGRRSYHGASRDLPAIFRPVGDPLVIRIDGRTTATFEVSPRRSPG